MRLERRCLSRSIVTIWCMSINQSDTEDEENDTRENRWPETVDMHRPSEVAEEQTASDSEGKKRAKASSQTST
ncbi:hypothetical protein CEXT_217991 [Caerostris extrusa]|uniref:Uncharacterized protein n=1 Tax=Caerostris extrusa TaxID=172846 RepID=A0AAV4XUP2_CAEEX|nr:hypothetical protein CEXT_217991 [Caerostris extrusa]